MLFLGIFNQNGYMHKHGADLLDNIKNDVETVKSSLSLKEKKFISIIKLNFKMLTNMLPIGNVALYNSCSPNLGLHPLFLY